MEKKWFTIAACLFMILPVVLKAQADPIAYLLKKYEGKPGVTTVSVTKDMIDLIPEEKIDNEDMGHTLKGLDGILVMTFEEESNSGFTVEEFYGDIMKAFPMKEFKEIMSVNDEDSKVKFLVRKADDAKGNDAKNNKVKEFIMITMDDEDVTLIWIAGDVNMSSLSRIGGISKILQFQMQGNMESEKAAKKEKAKRKERKEREKREKRERSEERSDEME